MLRSIGQALVVMVASAIAGIVFGTTLTYLFIDMWWWPF